MTLKSKLKSAAARMPWSRKSGAKPTLYCSFCGKSQHLVAALIAGPTVFICDECVQICTDIIAELRVAESRAAESKDASVESKDTPAEPHKIEDIPSMPTERLLHWLKIQDALSDRARAGVQEAIDTLRRREISWATIGEALGISRQAAWDRFS